MKGLTDVTQTFNDAAVEKRVLKANIETLRAKVKIHFPNLTDYNMTLLNKHVFFFNFAGENG